jgi:hypothetical protein
MAAMERRRKTPKKDWVITKDDVGRSVLKWQVNPLHTKRVEDDPCACTHDLLNRLDSPDLALEEERAAKRESSPSFNPYEREAPPRQRKKSRSV